MAAPLLLADAPWLLYRAWFSLPDSITGADGEPANALLGATNALLAAAEAERPRAVVPCFGAESGAYRVAAYPDYHADRPEMPAALRAQFAAARELWAALGWAVREHDELEADDVMHSLALREAERGGTALLLTGDRDMYQCASAATTILMPVRGRDEPARVDPDEVQRRYGVDPPQVPDFIALRGDPSDGLPGARGIGEKTAGELLARHRDLETLLAAAIRERPGVRRALLADPELLRSFADIATLRDTGGEPPRDAATDRAAGAQAARRAGLTGLATRLESTDG